MKSFIYKEYANSITKQGFQHFEKWIRHLLRSPLHSVLDICCCYRLRNQKFVYAIFQGSTKAMMQSDGNFILYDDASTTKWSTGTSSKNSTFLVLENSGNLVLFDQDQNSLWATNTTASCLGKISLEQTCLMKVEIIAAVSILPTAPT